MAVKVTQGMVTMVKDHVQRGYAMRDIAGRFGIGLTTVSLIARDKYQTKGLESSNNAFKHSLKSP